MIISYILGYLVTQTILVIWFFSILKITLGRLIFNKEINSLEDFDTALLIRCRILGKLSACYVCCSFWVSILIGGLSCILGYPWYTFLLTGLTYPTVAYLYYKRV